MEQFAAFFDIGYKKVDGLFYILAFVIAFGAAVVSGNEEFASKKLIDI